MKSLQEWIDYNKRKIITAKKAISYAELCLDNPEYYYKRYTGKLKKTEKLNIKNDIVIEKNVNESVGDTVDYF